MEAKKKISIVIHLIKNAILLMVTLLSCFSFINAFANDDSNTNEGEKKNLSVRGTIVGIILTETLKGPSFLIIQLDDEKKYRLKPEHGLGFIVGSDVEIHTTDTYEEDEISLLYKKMIYVREIKVTAMAIPGSKKKIKIPTTNPPEILYQSEEILKKIEKFKLDHR